MLKISLNKKPAKIDPNEVPTIIKATGKVANVLMLVIDEPTMPLKKTVIGAAVKENTCDNTSSTRFLLITIS